MTDALFYAHSIVKKLIDAKYMAYFAGGWVRDYLMGKISQDIDIATDASPEQIIALFPQTILVGLSFGVVIVVIEDHQFEVATFRKDLEYKDGRHPEGIEKSTPTEDAIRRDFTINGMFYDPLTEEVFDYVKGKEDLQAGIIRTIGNPHERFHEDRLRMLRAFRFAARFNFIIESETQRAILENANQLFPAVAVERVWQEFNKMAAYPRFDQALLEMHRLNLLGIIFPEIKALTLEDLSQKVRFFPDFPKECPTLLYILNILFDLSYSQKLAIFKRFKISNKELKLFELIETLHDAIENEKKRGEVNLKQWVALLANPQCEIGLEVLATHQPENKRREFLQKYKQRAHDLALHIQRLKLGQPLVSASLLQQEGILPGRSMGVLLKEAEEIAINENYHDPLQVISKLKNLPTWKAKP